MAMPRSFRHTPRAARAPQGAPPTPPLGAFACRPRPMSARPSRGSFPHRELHPRPQRARPHAGPRRFSAPPPPRSYPAGSAVRLCAPASQPPRPRCSGLCALRRRAACEERATPRGCSRSHRVGSLAGLVLRRARPKRCFRVLRAALCSPLWQRGTGQQAEQHVKQGGATTKHTVLVAP